MIIPFALWQGAFYERLIKSIKHSFYKTSENQHSRESLNTMLAGIEETLNSGPLTYQEEHWDDRPTLCPIDSIQRNVDITYPMNGLEDASDDPDYHPSDEALQLQTRRQAAKEALRSSWHFTE
ncbi:Integrase catalytic domain-containing protein [Trichostrongylus colubriformis]|uniref:Integrase catalytic domain-containing protein n=1 Tax=Trichostrongylus colubriformis TaxID=6319 RepID=A0AAN8FU24_TRICO